MRSLFAEGEIFMSDTIYLAKAERSLDLICMYEHCTTDPWKYSILFLTMLMKAGCKATRGWNTVAFAIWHWRQEDSNRRALLYSYIACTHYVYVLGADGLRRRNIARRPNIFT